MNTGYTEITLSTVDTAYTESNASRERTVRLGSQLLDSGVATHRQRIEVLVDEVVITVVKEGVAKHNIDALHRRHAQSIQPSEHRKGKNILKHTQ